MSKKPQLYILGWIIICLDSVKSIFCSWAKIWKPKSQQWQLWLSPRRPGTAEHELSYLKETLALSAWSLTHPVWITLLTLTKLQHITSITFHCGFHSTLGCLAQVKVKNPNAKVKLYHLELRWQGAGTLTSVPCQVWARLHLSQHVVELSLVVKQPHLRNVRMGKEGSEVVYLLVLPCLLQFILRKASYFRPRILKGCQQRSLTDSNSFHVWPTFYK